ncbi:MAG TPA: DNA polymerase III subunit alpha [Candidatus Angelobacter sp.]|jgi:DNA polymerase-3 subunit alpha|nr:DNA polymerase III subunit alpha [Candidatus Angelobacter sp.]
MYVILDTETSGLTSGENWPCIVQIAWQCYNTLGELVEFKNFFVKPEGLDIPFNSTKIHGITTEKVKSVGDDLFFVLNCLEQSLEKSKFVIGHNIEFDINVLYCEFFRKNIKTSILKKIFIDTKKAIPSLRRNKWPTLKELYQKLFRKELSLTHNAIHDVTATSKCFFELIRIGVLSFGVFGIKLLEKFKKKQKEFIDSSFFPISFKREIKIESETSNELLYAKNFSHLHNHTCFSILCSTIDVRSLVNRAVEQNMPAVGITDYGNLMGVAYFMESIRLANTEINKYNEKSKKYGKRNIKGVLGCEVFIDIKNSEKYYPQVLLAKNKRGFQNLSKISSYGFTDRDSFVIPKVCKSIIKIYKEELIALSGDINSEIPSTILNRGCIEAEKVFCWWNECFGSDFYVELLRHGLKEEDYVNKILLKLAKKYRVKYIAQNNPFYLDKKDSDAQDILLCVRKGEKLSTPIGKGKGFRFGFPNKEFYLKTSKQIENIFSDIPESFNYLEELLEKVEDYDLMQNILLPKLQKSFKDPNAFLKHLTYKGAKYRYGKITSSIKTRIELELDIIKKTGYPGYFLIVQDFTSQARKMDVSVGPGRGSVAGSVVAYCIGITDIDPIKYGLLFERFLNPDRVSMPDIDIDFDDRGRDKIIKWVVEKYGTTQVAHIITYGTLASKLSIRDTARVLGLPLSDVDRITKMIPNISLKRLFSENISSLNLFKSEIKNVIKIRKIYENSGLESLTLRQAKIIEGSIRSTGIHACGIIIAPSDIRELIPVSGSSELLVTQFDNEVVESVGLLKMDFLGLKTLTIIKDALNLIKKKNPELDSFPLDDIETYKLFQKGETVAVFQYESTGMQKYLRKLKPDTFYDLIAMNALYRPGPMQYIPNFIARKHGLEPITYDLPEMEEFLSNTYGITIYQEQVMLLAEKLAEFRKGHADLIRKAIGKKQKNILDKMKERFFEGAKRKGYSQKILEKIWKDWEAFSYYAFNKSHSTCYAYIAFETAYLKAHFTEEYMASVLSNNLNNLKEITLFMEECRRMGIPVLRPDINESDYAFTVTKHGEIRFGFGSIKGIGRSVLSEILSEREKNGIYTSIFDFVKRIDLRLINKKVLENFILAGAFDCFETINRAQYFKEEKTLEKIILFGLKNRKNSLSEPILAYAKPWPKIIKLTKEKEVLGIYITSHTLKYEIKNYVSLCEINQNKNNLIGKILNVCGIVLKCEKKISYKSGNRYGLFSLEDHKGCIEFRIFGEEYLKYIPILQKNALIHLKTIPIQKQNGEIYFRILHIQLLQSVNMTNSLIIRINVDKLNESLINQLKTIIKNGNKKFYIKINSKKIKLMFISKYLKIDIKKLKDDLGITPFIE